MQGPGRGADRRIYQALGEIRRPRTRRGAAIPVGILRFEQELLSRLVALNHERAAEEKRGLIRWLRPEYQNPEGRGGPAAPISQNLPGTETTETPKIWSPALSAQVSAVQKLLSVTGPDPAALADHFGKRSKARVQQIAEILKTLEGLGKL